MKGKEKISTPKSSVKKTGNHFTSDEVRKFTDDPLVQQMIDRVGLVCPTCTKVMLKNYCPDCGSKTIIPNFCKTCKLETSTQFCENCGTIIYLEGMEPKKFLYLSGNTLERQLTKLISLLSTPSDYQIQIYSLIEIVIQVLSDIKDGMSPLSDKLKKMAEIIDGLEKDISHVEVEIERSSESLNERISETRNLLFNKSTNLETLLTKIDGDVVYIEDRVCDIDHRVDDFNTYGVYYKPGPDI